MAAEIGETLASNMAAAFALELALKLLYMTFHEQPPNNTHDLAALWQGLPPEWRDEIGREYGNDPRAQSDVRLTALQRAPDPPSPPDDYRFGGVAVADGLFAATSSSFQNSRYFYEQVKVGEWAHIDHPINQMLAMLDVLTAFYEHLLKEAEARAE